MLRVNGGLMLCFVFGNVDGVVLDLLYYVWSIVMAPVGNGGRQVG